jgi:hypothetical protein
VSSPVAGVTCLHELSSADGLGPADEGCHVRSQPVFSLSFAGFLQDALYSFCFIRKTS